MPKRQSHLFAPAPPVEPAPAWGTLDWSEAWLRVWHDEWATDAERDAYHDLLPAVKAARGVTGKCLVCANEARRIVMRGRWKAAS